MTNKQAQTTINAIKFMLDHAQYSEDVEEALNMAINALTAQLSSSCAHENDSISRQAAIDTLDGEIEITGRTNAEAVKGYVRLVKDRLERLPSAQPDLSSYSDKLWRNAYERGRKEAMEEIIHCRDCRHYPSEYADCPMIGWARNENDFCSKAER